MKKTLPITGYTPSEGEIRDYAYHLYESRGFAPGHEVEDWLEARVYLEKKGPIHRADSQLTPRGDTTLVHHTSTRNP
jgi:hypothetical protein